jgi:hypothetical protein
VLLICLETGSVADEIDFVSELPVLALTEAERARVSQELDNLTELGAFAARLIESQTGEADG